MERDNIQALKGFAFNDSAPAGTGSLPAEEKWMRSYCSRAGRPICSGRIENRYNGGHKDEEIKIRPAVESCWHLGDKPMRFITFYIDKLYGMDTADKIFLQFTSAGGDF